MEQELNDPVQKAPGHWRGQITSKDVPDCCVPAERNIMKVYVIGLNGLGLSPTTPRKARILLKSGRAGIAFRQPFTIRLHYKTGCAHPDGLCIGIDTGSQHIGASVISRAKETVLSKEEYTLRSTMEKRSLLETRKSLRRGRRYRNVRYRHPKFKPVTKRCYLTAPVKRSGHLTHWKKEANTFDSQRPDGWLPPSIQSKLDHHIRIISRYAKALPKDTVLRIEIGRFDVQHMENPEIRGELYQRGAGYGFENLKAYIFARDQYTCQCCKKKGGTKREDGTTVKLIVHHIDFRSKGASDNPKHLITVCDRCHTGVAHKPGGILYQWMLQNKTVARGYRDSAVMNILRRRLWKAFPNAEFTYGNITTADRKILFLEKAHCNDATAIAAHGLKKILDIPDTTYYRQLRKQKRSIHESIPRKGRKEPNWSAKRNKKNTCRIGKLYLNDKVRVFGRNGWISGFSGTISVYVKTNKDEYIKVPGKSHKLIPAKELTVRTHCNNWAVCNMKTILYDKPEKYKEALGA